MATWHDDEMLTTEQAAERMGYKPRTLEDWRLNDRGPDYSRTSATRGVRYRWGDCRTWQEAQKVKANA